MLKGLENALLVRGFDSDSRIGDEEVERHGAFVAALDFDAKRDLDAVLDLVTGQSGGYPLRGQSRSLNSFPDAPSEDTLPPSRPDISAAAEGPGRMRGRRSHVATSHGPGSRRLTA